MQRLRTPDERFANLPDFDFEPHYLDVVNPTGGDSLRLAYIDEGPRDASETFVLLHGEPTWSFLYRKMITPLAAAGHRVVAPDLIGFGRSDKPTPRGEYTFERMVAWVREALFDQLDLRDVTLFGQDWGSLIGLRLVGEHPERFARVAIGNGGLPTGAEAISEAFLAWQNFSQTVPEMPIGWLIKAAVVHGLDPEVEEAYNAPFPTEDYKEGARQLPLLVPTSTEDPAYAANVAAWQTLSSFVKPFLTCYSDGDPITKGADAKFLREVPGCAGQPHVTIAGGGHFLQEDRGAEIADVLINWVRGA